MFILKRLVHSVQPALKFRLMFCDPNLEENTLKHFVQSCRMWHMLLNRIKNLHLNKMFVTHFFLLLGQSLNGRNLLLERKPSFCSKANYQIITFTRQTQVMQKIANSFFTKKNVCTSVKCLLEPTSLSFFNKSCKIYRLI